MLHEQKLNFVIVTSSSSWLELLEGTSGSNSEVMSETVYGNPMYPLKACRCVANAVRADKVEKDHPDVKFDSFIVGGGQCPYELMGDLAVLKIIDNAEIAAAVCHGPEALVGSKWLRAPHIADFTAYHGCWMSWRGEAMQFYKDDGADIRGYAAEGHKFFTGRNPNATRPMTTEACQAIKKLRAAK